MTLRIEQEIEKYFGEVLSQHCFQAIYRETTPVGACIIYASGACRLRFVKERTDTNLAIGGAEAILDASNEAGWFPLDRVLDFIEDRRSVAHLVKWNPDQSYDLDMRETAQRLTQHLSTLIDWFMPEGLTQRLESLEEFRNWRLLEIKRYKRTNQK